MLILDITFIEFCKIIFHAYYFHFKFYIKKAFLLLNLINTNKLNHQLLLNSYIS